MVEGTINGFPFQTSLEPDGKWSHWFRVDDSLLGSAHAGTGDKVTLAIGPMKEWPEPDVPADLNRALSVSPQARALQVRYADGALGMDSLDTRNQFR